METSPAAAARRVKGKTLLFKGVAAFLTLLILVVVVPVALTKSIRQS